MNARVNKVQFGKGKRQIWVQMQSCYGVTGRVAIQLVSMLGLYQVSTPHICSDWSGLFWLVDACAVMMITYYSPLHRLSYCLEFLMMVSQIENNLFLMATALKHRATIHIHCSHDLWWCAGNRGADKTHLLFCEFDGGRFTKLMVCPFGVADELLSFVLPVLEKNSYHSFSMAPLKTH